MWFGISNPDNSKHHIEQSLDSFNDTLNNNNNNNNNNNIEDNTIPSSNTDNIEFSELISSLD